jgi:hypothetical protein
VSQFVGLFGVDRPALDCTESVPSPTARLMDMDADRQAREERIDQVFAELQDRHASAAESGALQKARQALEASESDRAARLQIIDTLSGVCAERLELINRLTEDVGVLRAESSARMDQITVLTGRISMLEEQWASTRATLRHVVPQILHKLTKRRAPAGSRMTITGG